MGRRKQGRPPGKAAGDVAAGDALQLLLDVTAAAAEAPDLDAMITRCLARICALRGWPVGQAWFPDERAGVLVCSPASVHADLELGEFRRASLASRFPRGVGLPGRIWETLAPAWIVDPPGDDNFPRGPQARAAGLRAAFGFPILQGQRLLAVFEFFSPELREPEPAFLDAVGKLGRHLAIVFERRRDDALRTRLAAFVEASPDIIASADPTGRLTYMNAAGRRLLGIGADEEIDRLRVADLYTREHLAMLEGTIIPTAVRDGVWRGDLPLRTRDGREVPVSHVLTAHQREGRLEFLACVGHDLSERRHLEREAREAQKMEAIGRLAGGMAHDFNNFLTSIVCASSAALRRLGPADDVRRDVEEILAASERAASLTRQLLSFSRPQPQVVRPLEVDPFVAGLARMLQLVVGDRVELRLAPGAQGATVLVDPGQVEQVLLNLALNARDAMPHGGRLTLRTAEVERVPRRARLAGAEAAPARHVLLEVTDSGVGMDEATRARLFEPFFTTKGPRGTGLGLSTVWGVVSQCGGDIEVETQPGRGSTFRILLPRVDAAAAVEPPPDGAPAARAATILVVEDERGVRRSLRLLLELDGHTVLEAGDGVEALEVAASHPGPIDLLVSDVAMPRMGAAELVADLSRSRPALRVLLISGDGAAPPGLEGVRFLPKPFPGDALARGVRAALEDRPEGPVRP